MIIPWNTLEGKRIVKIGPVEELVGFWGDRIYRIPLELESGGAIYIETDGGSNLSLDAIPGSQVHEVWLVKGKKIGQRGKR